MNAVVSYIKHWDNNTRGSLSFGDVVSLVQAVELADKDLTHEAHQALIDGEWDLTELHATALFTITKAEIVDSVQVYAGVPKAAF